MLTIKVRHAHEEDCDWAPRDAAYDNCDPAGDVPIDGRSDVPSTEIGAPSRFATVASVVQTQRRSVVSVV